MADSYTKEESDTQHQAIVTAITAEVQSVQSAINGQIGGLMTKEQAEEILGVFNAILLALRITTKGGRFVYRAALMLAPFLVAMAVIYTFVKGGFTTVFAKFYP